MAKKAVESLSEHCYTIEAPPHTMQKHLFSLFAACAFLSACTWQDSAPQTPPVLAVHELRTPTSVLYTINGASTEQILAAMQQYDTERAAVSSIPGSTFCFANDENLTSYALRVEFGKEHRNFPLYKNYPFCVAFDTKCYYDFKPLLTPEGIRFFCKLIPEWKNK